MTAHDSAPAPASRRAAVRDREDAVVDRLRMLGTALDGEPDPQFRAATRARLVAMASVRQPAPAPKSWVRRLLERSEDRAPSVWRARMTAGLAGAALAVTALAALVAVSTSAGPGDPLYGLKRGTEQTKLALASDSTRGRTLLGFANTRLHELQDLVRQGATAAPAGAAAAPGSVQAAGPSSSLVLDTIATMDRQTTEGAYWVTTEAVRTRDAAALGYLSRWTADQTAGLSALTPQLPAAAQPAAQQSLALLGVVAGRSTALSPSLTCATGSATAASDQLGPVPVPCPAAPTAPTTGTGTGTTQQPGGSVGTLAPGAPTSGPPGSSSGGTLPGTGGTLPGTGGGGGGTTPTVPGLPLPTSPSLPLPGGGGGLPSLPTLPGLGAATSTSPSSGTTSSSPLPLPLPCISGLTC